MYLFRRIMNSASLKHFELCCLFIICIWPSVTRCLLTTGDFGIEDREILREETAFEDTAFIHGSSASNLLLEAEPGPAHLPDKSTNLDYDDFGDNNLENSDGGILGKDDNITDSLNILALACFIYLSTWFVFASFQWISSWAVMVVGGYSTTLRPSPTASWCPQSTESTTMTITTNFHVSDLIIAALLRMLDARTAV